MSTNPLVSVVTSVYNGAAYLRPSLESVLAQSGVEMEVVVVNDGSTDDSSRILEELAARDRRVRVLHQPNRGLTHALARGCAAARGDYVARHDADDLSLPGRLAKQLHLLETDPRLSMVSCWAAALGPAGEELFVTRRPCDPVEATRQLVEGRAGPPGHGSVMFRAEAYRRVGGYRAAFRYAQDWDLWLRLTEVGLVGYVPEVLYAYRVAEGSISAHRRDQQERLAAIARQCREARRAGLAEASLLEEAARVSAQPQPAGVARVGNSYFIGKCLLDRRDRRALPYLARSVRRAPWNWRHWVALAGAAVLCRDQTANGEGCG